MVYKRKYSYAAEAYKVPAETVGQTLEVIEARDGQVTKEAFLDASRPEDSPTHGMFEWRDDVAAEKYRLHQSKTIINNLRIEIDAEGAEPKTVKAYVNVSNGSQHSKARYINIASAMADDRSRGVLYRNALAELGAFKRKYRDLQELEPVFAVISAIGA